MYGRLIRRSRPVAPANRSRSRPAAAPRAPSRAPTVTPPGMSRLGFNQAEVTVRPPVQHGDGVGDVVTEHEKRAVARRELEHGVVDAHGPDGHRARADDALTARIGNGSRHRLRSRN